MGLAEFRTGESIIEDVPKGESSANGRAEDAGKRVRDQAKVLKDQVEWKTDGKLKASGDGMRWLVRWAAMILSRYHKGKYGKTRWERRLGEPCPLEVVPWGELVWYKKLKEDGAKDNKVDPKWEDGGLDGPHGEKPRSCDRNTRWVRKGLDGAEAARGGKVEHRGHQWD